MRRRCKDCAQIDRRVKRNFRLPYPAGRAYGAAMTIDTLDELIERAGSVKAAARELGIPESNLRYWRQRQAVPVWRAQQIEQTLERLLASVR